MIDQINDLIDINTVVVELTNKCFIGCDYCINNSLAPNETILDFNVAKNLIDDMKQINVKSIFLSGGEALLYPHILEIIDYCRKNDMDTTMISTVGSLLTEDVIKCILENDVSIISTIDGIRETHNSRRLVKNYDLILSSIETLYKKGFSQNYFIRCNLSYDNLDYIEDVVEECYNLGVTGIAFTFLFGYGRASWDNILNTNENYNIISSIKKRVEKLQLKYSDLLINFQGDICLGCPHSDNIINKQIKSSFGLKINVFGDVFICHMMYGTENSIGNIYNTHFADVSYKENTYKLLQKFEERKNINEECKTCIINSFCNCGCPAEAYSKYNSITKLDGHCNKRKSFFVLKEINNKKIGSDVFD